MSAKTARDCATRYAAGRGSVRVLLVALALDILLGDPPNRFHPTAWMGSLIGYAKKARPLRQAAGDPDPAAGIPRPAAEMVFGGALAIGGAAFFAALGALAQRGFRACPRRSAGSPKPRF